MRTTDISPTLPSLQMWLKRDKPFRSVGSTASHFQNGISEKRIRDLQEAARTALLDAKSRWPKAISTALWPK
eukprot:scaffold25213_cov162-Cylindrotheca_fusiformis.AAC.2